MSDPAGQQYDEDFFGNAFKFLQMSEENEENENNKDQGQETSKERKHFKLQDYSKENKPESPRVLDPEHPLMQKFQKALKEHFLKQIDQLNEDIYNLEANTKKLDAEREELGIETYEMQQMVCKEQQMIEEYLSEMESVSMANQELENQIENLSEMYNVEKKKLIEAEQKELELQTELESVSLLLQKMKCWENEVETELKTSLRISEKTKKEKIELATQKRAQDMIIYRLMSEVWKLENEIETMDMQMRVKEGDKERIAIAVAMSGTDIEALEAENRCLLQSWNSVVNAIGIRDKTYASIKRDKRAVNEQIKSKLLEIEQIKKITKREMYKNESLTMFKNRVQADLKNCAHLRDLENGKRSDIEKLLVNYQHILDATDAKIQEVNEECDLKDVEYRQVMREVETLSYEKVQLEEQILQLLQDQITNDKAGMYLRKLVRQVREKNQDLKITLAGVENTNAKTLMDIEAQKFINENAARLINELQKQQDELHAEIKKIITEKDKLQFTMHRKQREFDIINIKYDKAKVKFASNSSHEDKMHDLEKQIEEIELNIKNLQRYWLREQENMVILTKQRQEQIKDNNLLRKQILILEQKNLKIGDELEALQKHEEKMNRSITSLLSKQTMLQEQFNKKKGNKEDIGKENSLMQNEFMCKLEDAELDAIKLQAELEELEECKANLSKDLLDKNREALAWEKKWQLAVETKQNMSKEQSTEGEVGLMKAEIHRMNVRFHQLKRAQDKLIIDLEQCVTRRDAIATIADARDKRGTNIRPPKINYVRRLDDIKNKIKKVQMEIEDVDKDIEQTKKHEEELKHQIREMESYTFTLNDKIETMKLDIEYAITDKQKYLETTILHQRKLQMLNDIARRRPIKYLIRDEALLDIEFERQQEINKKLTTISSQMIEEFPNLEHELNRIKNTLQCCKDFVL